MTVSESEKLGVTILGHRFSDNVEHIPIKKRRFLFRTASPPPQTSSPSRVGSDQFAKGQHASGQGSSFNPVVGEKLVAMNSTVRLGQVVDMDVDNDRKNSNEINENFVQSVDFSGISILAAAACNNSMDVRTINAEDSSALEISSTQQGFLKVLMAEESCSLVEEPHKDHNISYTEISNERTDSCISGIRLEETAACLATATCFPEDIKCKTTAEALSSIVTPLSAKHKQLSSERNEASSSLRDDRSHWDLNIVMDAWDIPCLDPIVYFQEDVIGGISGSGCNEKAGKSDACEVRRESAATKHDTVNPVQPELGSVVGDGHECVYSHADLRSLAVGMDKSVREDEKVIAHASERKCQRIACFQLRTPSSEISRDPNSLMGLGNVSKCLRNRQRTSDTYAHQFDEEDTNITDSALHVVNTPISERNGDASSAVTTVEETEDDCHADAERAENICSGLQSLSAIAADKETGDVCPADAGSAENICSSPQSGKHCVGPSYAAIPRDALSGIHKIVTKDGEDAGRATILLETVKFSYKLQGTEDMKYNPLPSGPSDCVLDPAMSNSNEAHCSLSMNRKGLHDSHASAGRGEHVVGVEPELKDTLVFVANTTFDLSQIESDKLKLKPTEQTSERVETPVGLGSHEAYRSSENVASEDDRFDDVDYGSDVSLDEPLGIEKESELQMDYDSQYEDGEFREPHLHGWEGETEHVDCGLDNREAYDNEAAVHHPGSMTAQVNELAEFHGEYKTETADSKVDRGPLHQVDVDGGVSCRGYGSFKRKHSVACNDGLDNGDSVARMGKTSGWELLSCIDRSIDSVALCRSDRSDNLNDANQRAKREPASAHSAGRDTSSMLHMRSRGEGGDRWVGSSHWGPERYRSSGFGHPAPKNAAAAAAAKIETSDFVVASDGTVVKAGGLGRRRQSVNASSEGVHHTLIRRASPSDRDEALGIDIKLTPVSEMSLEKSLIHERVRSGRFGPQVVSERSRGPAPYDSSLRVQHPSVRRERSYSPFQGRGASHLPRHHTKSQSRSRTCSPPVWPSPRGRNESGIGGSPGPRHHTKSPPNFRSRTKMERGQSPHQRLGFLADHVAGFTPTSRIRSSSEHPSRWVNNRKDNVDHFREHGYKQRPSVSERSARRFFQQGHRFDVVGHTGRSKSGEYYRPTHPGRYPEMDGAGRGSRYDDSDDGRRKYDHRYGFVHPVRRYDNDFPLKKLRHDVEDFVAHDSYKKEVTEFHGIGSSKTRERGINSRLGDESRRSRERGHFRYSRE